VASASGRFRSCSAISRFANHHVARSGDAEMQSPKAHPHARQERQGELDGHKPATKLNRLLGFEFLEGTKQWQASHFRIRKHKKDHRIVPILIANTAKSCAKPKSRSNKPSNPKKERDGGANEVSTGQAIGQKQ